FTDRYGSMRWSILTPDMSAHRDGGRLTFGEGVPAPPTIGDDAIEDLWRTYYASVFNPARVNLRAMLPEMPVRRWARLPEAQVIPALLHSAHERTVSLGHATQDSARPFVPQDAGLEALREAASSCRGCDLYERASQAVFGEGRATARLVLVGEQP